MSSNFENFCQTIARLRSPDGCPWDLEQTHKSLTRYLLEETHEVLEAINNEDFGSLKEELGDLLLQIVLQSQLARENGHFDINDVINAIDKKMISRHPHVFSDNKLSTSNEVLMQWEQFKDAERPKTSALANIPTTLPALLKALKISEKAVNQGFEWEEEEDIWQQLDSEIEEFKQEAKKQIASSDEKIETKPESITRKSSVAHEDLYLEMGDILFTMVNIARWYKIDPEEALLMTIEKFKKRFQLMEKQSTTSLKELTAAQLNKLWQQAKQEIKNQA